MKPGRELDVKIAEHVMGWRLLGDKWYAPDSSLGLSAPYHFSNDIVAAWTVVERVKGFKSANGWGVMVGATTAGQYICWLKSRDSEAAEIRTYGVSAPHAICLAALKAVKL